MTQHHESIWYHTLDELQETYLKTHPDIIRLRNAYGNDIRLSRIMHRKGIEPRFELSCYKIVPDE